MSEVQQRVDMAAAGVVFAERRVTAVYSDPASTSDDRIIAHLNLERAQQELTNVQLMGTQPARVVLAGDPGEIEAALDALPVGSIVESSAEAVADGESRVWSREDNGMGQVAWRGTGGAYPAQSGYLARRCAPLVVISQ